MKILDMELNILKKKDGTIWILKLGPIRVNKKMDGGEEGFRIRDQQHVSL